MGMRRVELAGGLVAAEISSGDRTGACGDHEPYQCRYAGTSAIFEGGNRTGRATAHDRGCSKHEKETAMAPHITFFRMRAKSGERQMVIDHFDHWLRSRRLGLSGFIRVVLCSNVEDPDEFMAYAMFHDKATYDANSNAPEQHAWFEALRTYLVADPEWLDTRVERQRMGQV